MIGYFVGAIVLTLLLLWVFCGSLRLSLGHTSTDADVDAALEVLPAAVERARQAALAASGVVD